MRNLSDQRMVADSSVVFIETTSEQIVGQSKSISMAEQFG